MPGIFGAVGCTPEVCDALRQEFAALWPDCQVVKIESGMIGGHAFLPSSAVHTARNKMILAVDGELSIYQDAWSYTVKDEPKLFCASRGDFLLTKACKGNLVVADPETRTWNLATEWSGTFPLYYFLDRGKLLFCSHLRPLSRTVGAAVDVAGLAEQLLGGYTLAGRTLCRNINRLLPGQVLTYESSSDRFRLRETSRLWAEGERKEFCDPRTAAEAAWDALKNAIRDRGRLDGRSGLMMSAGWDSRLLLCSMLEFHRSDGLFLYTHGDLNSSELHITKSIRRSLGIEGHEEPLSNSMFDLDLLSSGFQRTETVVFPEWLLAGSILKEVGVRSVYSGVYGEVLGGHYGPTATLKGAKRLFVGAGNLIAQYLGFSINTSRYTPLFPQNIRVTRPSYVYDEFWESLSDLSEVIAADLAADVKRLTQRGVVENDKLAEAFTSEHRGSQYIVAQPLALRASLDVAVPFTDPALLRIVTQIPLHTKFQNALHRIILSTYGHNLLRPPISATIIPANMPIFLQEGSRLVRRSIEKTIWNLYFATRGKIKPPSFGWPNYEFLRDGAMLQSIIGSLSSHIWDKAVLKRWITAAANYSDHRKMIFISQSLLKIYSVDLMLQKSVKDGKAGKL